MSDSDRAAHQQFVENQKKVPQEVWNHFIQIKDNCIGCGICEKVCPSSSIHIVDGKAVYHFNHCQTCLACAHACPQKAIGLAIPEKIQMSVIVMNIFHCRKSFSQIHK